MLVASVLCDCLGLERWTGEPVPGGERCALTGAELATGVQVRSVITPAQSEIMELNDRVDGWVHPDVATAVKAYSPRSDTRPNKSILWVAGQGHWQPYVEARDDSPAWSNVVRRVWPAGDGQPCAVVYNADFRRRVWVRARVGALGQATPVYIHDMSMGISTTRVVSWPRLIECLDVIEEIMAYGIPKGRIAECLVGAGDDLPGSREWPRRVADWRRRDEFVLALKWARRVEECSR